MLKYASMQDIQNFQNEFKGWIFRLFTQHPHEAGETFWQHLAFTMQMSARFLYVSVVIFLHGLFPFLLKCEGSKQIEKIYGIMKNRQPKNAVPECNIDYEI